MRRLLGTAFCAGVLLVSSATVAGADPLPDNCTKDRGTVTCSTFEGPGNNQAGVGSTTTDETQGNTTNTSPQPQELESDCTTNPENSQGAPNTC